MTDERQSGLLFESWLKGTDPTPPDASRSVAQVMARVPEIRQRGRWWPLPVFHRKARTATATDTTDYRPRLIPATSGHAPTVIGRTQTMFSPVKAITAGALVFALGGLFLVAQPFDQQGGVPGAEQAAVLAPPVFVTITVSDLPEVVEFEEVSTVTAGGVETNTWGGSSQWSATDPRLSGTETTWVNERTWQVRDGIFEAYTTEVVNDEGAWVGTGRYVGPLDLFVLTLTGEGEYEGLAAVVTEGTGEDDPLRAVIVDGGLPPFPEPIE